MLHLIFMVVSSVTPGHHKIAQKGKKKGQLYNSYFSEEHALRVRLYVCSFSCYCFPVSGVAITETLCRLAASLWKHAMTYGI